MSEAVVLIPASNIVKCPATYHRENIDLENNPITGEQITPIIVRPSKTHAPKFQMFERVTGDRRYEKEVNERGLNGLIKCLVQDLTDEEAMEISVKDNEQRKSLTLYEKSKQVLFYCSLYKDKLNEKDIADLLGFSPSLFSQFKRIGENLKDNSWFSVAIKEEIISKSLANQLLQKDITIKQRESISSSLLKEEINVSQATKMINDMKTTDKFTIPQMPSSVDHGLTKPIQQVSSTVKTLVDPEKILTQSMTEEHHEEELGDSAIRQELKRLLSPDEFLMLLQWIHDEGISLEDVIVIAVKELLMNRDKMKFM